MSGREAMPGLAFLVAGALAAHLLAPLVGVDRILLAIAVGALCANTVGIPGYLREGVATYSVLLGAGIVLLGASIPLGALVESGPVLLALVLGVAGGTLALVELIARVGFDLSERLRALLAAGTSICGVSAVVAVASAIRARQEHIAYAAATVLLFDAVTIVIYPVLGSALGLSDAVFGIWAGLSMFSTGPVVAVGFAHSEVAGQWATMTKLARNALIGVVVVAYAARYADTGNQRIGIADLYRRIPAFVVGFLVLAVVANAGLLSEGALSAIGDVGDWLFLLAFVGVGADVKLSRLRETGVAPLVVVALAFVVTSTLTLAAALALFG
ncbi:YeiH family protein [Natronorarus salvus]|uniref:YeiH family protein n=1 Tax=Natronorarus salvus TaxID=3117733 RepID=UPI002F263338